ncbi:50S ribosomal protein L3 [Patescibacteria group bacterium]|nr:50S ribosomal protein L3 [Patescibacteria group bacterium]MBU1034767.1 50S ribosomal protein L3 [Patescibacteria group bacterium]MBU1908031.1 50S ribosomal protein L3 [Patescibacteria group bacterium]
MKFILAKKLEMSQIFRPDGTVVPVTLVQAGPCVVTQVKDVEKEGYKAVQIGFSPLKKLSKPSAGHLKELDKFGILREFRITDPDAFKRGDTILASAFTSGDKINATGVSKGKGFQGVVKRHGFHGAPASHGHKDQERMPGSSGPGGVQHVLKGTKKPGRMGGDRVTVKNLEVIEVRDNGILAIKGAIPGCRNSLVELRSDEAKS